MPDQAHRKGQFVVGTELGGFRLEGILGSGGMGVVYRAHQLSLGRPVALKLLNAGLTANRPERERFIQEGVLSAKVVHPHLVRIFEVGQAEGRLFLAYELIEGETLRQKLLRDAPLPVPLAIEIASVIADVLATLHGHSILHRDLKPENVFLSPTRGPMVGDLGIAKDLLGSGVRTQQGLILGTPEYMAPEFLDGRPASPASDLYALGVLLFEMLAGFPPFKAKDPLENLELHAKSPIPDIALTRPELSNAVRRVLDSLLKKAPRERPSSAGQMVELLRVLATSSESAVGSTRRQSAPVPRKSSREARTVTAGSPKPQSPRLRVAGALLAGGLLLTSGVVLWPRPPAPALVPPSPVRPVVRLPRPPAAPLPAARAARSLLAARTSMLLSWKHAAEVHARCWKSPDRMAPQSLPDELFALLLEPKPLIRAALGDFASAAKSGVATAPEDAGRFLVQLTRLILSHRSTLWGALEAGRQKAPQPFGGRVHPSLAFDALVHRYEERAARLAAELAAEIPQPLLESKDDSWRIGLGCLRSMGRWVVGGRAAARLQTELAGLIRPAFQSLARDPRPEDLETLDCALRALEYAGVVAERQQTLETVLSEFARREPLRPGERLLQLQLKVQLAESFTARERMDARDEANARRLFETFLDCRNLLIRSWPYDPRKPAPVAPSAAQRDALEFDSAARAYLGVLRERVDKMAQSMRLQVPKEP